MENIINYTGDLLFKTLQQVAASVIHNWKILAFAAVISAALKTYVNSDKFSSFLMRKKKVSILASVLFGAFTPLCACGTSAVVLGMLTTTLPWGPIMAFLTSSPLMSPDGFVFISGIISLRFAVMLTVASVVIGLGSGFITILIEKKTKFLVNQSRYVERAASVGCSCSSTAAAVQIGNCNCADVKKQDDCSCNDNPAAASCACGTPAVDTCTCGTPVVDTCSCGTPVIDTCSCGTPAVNTCTCGTASATQGNIVITEQGDQLCCYVKQDNDKFNFRRLIEKYKVKQLAKNFYELGIRQMLLYFSIFIGVGYLINHFVPTSIISALFGADAFYAVPLASLIGLPLYLTTDSAIPIIQSMMSSGASEGAMLAFIITGSATSAWVIAGLSTFMKKRAILLYTAFILAGGIIFGYLYDLFLMFA